MRAGIFDGCILYGMPFEKKEEEKEFRFDRFPPLYWRMNRSLRYRWPYSGW